MVKIEISLAKKKSKPLLLQRDSQFFKIK